MAFNVKKIIGEFLGRRSKNPDTSADPWDPIRDGSPLEKISPVVLSVPSPIPFEPAPALSAPGSIPIMPAPPLSKPAEIAFEPAPALRTPDQIAFEPAPPLSVPAIIPFEPAPPLRTPAIIPFEPAPDLRVPNQIAFEPAPPLSVPAIIPFEPAPPLSIPAIIPFEPAPPLSVPAVIPFEPAPPSAGPAVLPDMPAPPPSVRSTLPDMPAPAHAGPSSLPSPPDFSPVAPANLPEPPAPKNAIPHSQTVNTKVSHPADHPIDHSNSLDGKIRGETNNTKPHAPGGIVDVDVLGSLQTTDKRIIELFSVLDSGERYVNWATGPGTQAMNPDLYAKQLTRLGTHLGKSGLALFAAEQLGLFVLNRHGKIWNPLTIAPVPIAQNFVPAALDVLTGTPRILTGFDDSQGASDVTSSPGFFEKNHGPGGDDRQLALAKGEFDEFRVVHYPPFFEAVFGAGSVGVQNLLGGVPLLGGGRIIGARSQDTSLVDDPVFGSDGTTKPIVLAALELRNKYYPGEGGSRHDGVEYQDHVVAPLSDLIDDALTGGTKTGHIVPDSFTDLQRYTYRRATQAGDSDATAGLIGKVIAAGRSFIGDRVQGNTGEFRPEPGEASGASSIDGTRLARAAFTHGIIPAAFKKENKNGTIVTRSGQSPSDVISDDDAYVPLSFTDLRPADGNYRTVYFRPFLKGFSESFTPEWNQTNFFGRVDPVVTYQATGRSIAISFMLAAFGPEDVRTIWNKLTWLTSMVYPEYDRDLGYVSGPVVRMRIGDVINAIGPEGGRGLPGIITSLEFDYSDAVWELKEGLKVPREIQVAMSFLVLHDRPIGRGANAKFGGLGTIKDGLFVPPGREGDAGAGSNDGTQMADVTKGMDSFRLIGRSDADSINDYDRLVASNSTLST